MKRIIIKGEFRIYGDIPALDKIQQPLQEAIIGIEIENLPIARLTQFKSSEPPLNNFKASALNNGQIMAQLLKQEVYCESGKLRHLIGDVAIERFIQELEEPKPCPQCKGTGSYYDYTMFKGRKMPCQDCSGQGFIKS